MFLPLGDYPNPPKPQWITRILIGLNVAIHLFVAVPLERKPVTMEDEANPEVAALIGRMWEAYEPRARAAANQEYADGRLSRPLTDREVYAQWRVGLDHYSLFTFQYGYKPGMPTLIGLFFCMFLHGGWLHLGGNMLYLWIFGDNVEARLGPVGYLAAYMLTGMAATLSFAMLDSSSLIPLVGASGAISGVLGFYFLWFPNNQIRVLVFFFFILFVHVRAVWVLGVFLVIDNLLPFLQEQAAGVSGGVAHGAHLGGFLAGVAAAFVLNRVRGAPARPASSAYRRVETVRWGDPNRRARLAKAMEDHGLSFAKAMKEGRMEDAAHAFSSLVREGGLPPDEGHVFQLARWLYENDFVPDAAAVFRYYLRSYPRGRDLDRVHLGLGILLARRLGQPVPAREHLLQAIDLAGPDSAIATTARQELDALR